MSRPNDWQQITHGEPDKINSSLDYIFDLFNKNIIPLVLILVFIVHIQI